MQMWAFAKEAEEIPTSFHLTTLKLIAETTESKEEDSGSV